MRETRDLPDLRDGLFDAERRLLERVQASNGSLLIGPDGLDALAEALPALGRHRLRRLEQVLDDAARDARQPR